MENTASEALRSSFMASLSLRPNSIERMPRKSHQRRRRRTMPQSSGSERNHKGVAGRYQAPQHPMLGFHVFEQFIKGQASFRQDHISSFDVRLHVVEFILCRWVGIMPRPPKPPMPPEPMLFCGLADFWQEVGKFGLRPFQGRKDRNAFHFHRDRPS